MNVSPLVNEQIIILNFLWILNVCIKIFILSTSETNLVLPSIKVFKLPPKYSVKAAINVSDVIYVVLIDIIYSIVRINSDEPTLKKGTASQYYRTFRSAFFCSLWNMLVY